MKEYLLKQIERYPEMQVEDAVKLLYQSEFGGGHMIKNPQASLKRLEEEWRQEQARKREESLQEQERKQEESLQERERKREESQQICRQNSENRQTKVRNGLGQEVPDVEEIGDGMCRINLQVLGKGFSPETLNQIFVQTADRKVGKKAFFEKKLDMLRECSKKGEVPFSFEDVEEYMEAYKSQEYPPVSHSERYRSLYHPAYRVAAEYYTRYYDIFLKIDRLRTEAEKEDKPVLVSIDGMCGSGKSTMGRILKEIYGCRLFHMDDYFLRPCQRTGKRLEEPGGNVDYERFQEEILSHIQDREGLEYRPYDCQTQALGEAVKIPYHSLNIVEGVYSQHPYFGDIYDLRIFCRIEKEEQARRILKRNGQEMLKRFQSQWIPMENRYFETFHIGKDDTIWQ